MSQTEIDFTRPVVPRDVKPAEPRPVPEWLAKIQADIEGLRMRRKRWRGR